MLNDTNIKRLVETLSSIGFPQSIESKIRMYACIQPEHFSIRQTFNRDGDTITFQLYFQKQLESNDYSCNYYEAYLKKRVEIPNLLLNGVEMKLLEQKMYEIDWFHVYSDESLVIPLNMEIEREIQQVTQNLIELSSTPDGSHLSELIKWKYWSGTKLECYCTNSIVLKNAYEINQRFYFFEEEHQISLDEAYRFLCHRWREKKLTGKKKVVADIEQERVQGNAPQKANGSQTKIKSVTKGSRSGKKE